MSELDKLTRKNINEYTPIEHAIFRIWCEAQESDSRVVFGMAKKAAEQLASLRAERDEARKLIEFLKAVVKDQDIPFTTETCAVLKKHIERFILADPEQ